MNELTLRIVLCVLGAVVSGIVGAMARKFWDQRDLISIEKGRKDYLAGNWEGNFEQAVGPNGETPFLGTIDLILEKPRGKLVRGKARFNAAINNKKLPVDVDLEGGFRNERFAALNYVNRDKATVHFGHFLLDFSDDGKSLKGRFVGYGFISNRLVFGTVDLIKKETP